MIKTTITYKRSPELVAKEFRKIVKAQLQEIGKLWHKGFLPLHFARGARQRYNYAPRSKRYERRKLRKFGHTKPLVFTGRMERELKRRHQVTGTGRSVKVRMKAPPYAKYHNKLREVTVTTQQEATVLAHELHDRVIRAIEQLRENRKVEVG